MGDDRFECGGIYWPLQPFGMVVNELAFIREPPKEYALHDLVGISVKVKATYADYADYFLLESTEPTNRPPTHFRIPPMKFGAESKLVDVYDDKAGLNSPELRDCLQYAMRRFPQRKNESHLVMSKFWHALPTKDDKFYEEFPKLGDFPGGLTKHESLVCRGEHLLLAAQSAAPGTRAFDELLQLKCVRRVLPDRNTKLGKSHAFLMRASFFADGILDAVLSLFVTQSELSRGENKKRLEDAFHGLSRVILAERRDWLYRWVMKLGEAVNVRLTNPIETPNKTRKFAAEAMARMCAVLTFESKRAVFNKWKGKISRALDQDSPSPFREITASLCEARREYIAPILDEAFRNTHGQLRGFAGGELKGMLAANASSQLNKYARFAPTTARIILKSQPGGGKGVAAKDYHTYVMQQIFSAPSFQKFFEEAAKIFPDPVAKRSYRVPKAVSDLAKKDENALLWLEFFRNVADRLYALRPIVAESPHLQGDGSGFLTRQLRGTNWARWHAPALASLGSDTLHPKGARKRPATLMLALTKTKHTPDNVSNEWKRELGAYLWRLTCQVQHCLGNPKDWDFNFTQITCGSLGGEGAELISSLRHLFGYCDSWEGALPAPGLLQTCSYKGGTLFLDEIADMPIRVQDNFLLPLEEGKVYREGMEASPESVANVRFISATHKDLKEAVAEYKSTAREKHRRGFRPDLLTRLAGSEPVFIEPVSAYFNVDATESETKRDRYRDEFVSIMLAASNGVGHAFWKDVYDKTDEVITSHVAVNNPAIPAQQCEARAKLTEKVSMRFFVNIGKMRKEALLRDGVANPDEQRSFILNEHIESTLKYLLNG